MDEVDSLGFASAYHFDRKCGRGAEVRHLVGDDLVAALAKKLVEEAHEAAEAIGKRGDLVEELADVREVMSALMATQGITDQDVAVAAAAKALNRGAFEDGVWLVGQVAGLNS